MSVSPSIPAAIALEICVDDAAGLDAAIAGGADRIELCSALGLGGLTPTLGLIERARSSPVPVFAMIRPRAGDFRFDDREVASMMRDIDAVREAGLAGVVLGANAADGRLAEPVLRRLLERSRGLGTTLHRAFDLAPDMGEALDLAIALGFERVLTSGGKRSVIDGLETLAGFCDRAGARISIMPGSGVRPGNLRAILARLGSKEVHSSASASAPPALAHAVELGFASPDDRRTDEATVGALRAEIDRHLAGVSRL